MINAASASGSSKVRKYSVGQLQHLITRHLTNLKCAFMLAIITCPGAKNARFNHPIIVTSVIQGGRPPISGRARGTLVTYHLLSYILFLLLPKTPPEGREIAAVSSPRFGDSQEVPLVEVVSTTSQNANSKSRILFYGD